MSNYYFRRASDLKTDQLVDIVMDIDNGHYDEIVDEKEWFNKITRFRNEIIEVLLKRYQAHHLVALGTKLPPNFEYTFFLFLPFLRSYVISSVNELSSSRKTIFIHF